MELSLIRVLTYADIQQSSGSVVLEFGAQWCGHCQNAQALIAAALANYPEVQHIKVEDGKGKRLGRLFGIKLWPTLVFIKNGVEMHRIVRPTAINPIQSALKNFNNI